jgi:AraC-like DNA-binding protein
MSKTKKNIAISFDKSNPNQTEDFSIINFSGNHWDDIFYFPKMYQIWLIREGEGVFALANESFKLSKGDAFFVKPALLHKGKPNSETGWAVTILTFKPAIIDAFVEEGAIFSVFNQLKPDDSIQEKLEKLLLHFEEEISIEDAKNVVYDFLIECSDKDGISQKTTEQHLAVIKAQKYIDKNFKSKFSLDDLADEACLSKFHLLRLFKQEVGLAPLTYQLQLKLNEARKLIFLKKSLTEVAYELGFNDQAHFINTYKKYTEITPGDFLKTAIFYNSEVK